MIRIAQLSDTHFLEPGEGAEGGFAYDTDAAFEAVRAHLGDLAPVDLAVVTGDIADHGRLEQYRIAADAFEQLNVPVNVTPGNHDFDAPFAVGMGRTTISSSRVIEAGGWCFLFVDSNAGAMLLDESGRLVDPPGEARLHLNGTLGDRERAWIADMCATTAAEHVFVWVHHPPSSPVGLTDDTAYAAEWDGLLKSQPKIKGIGAGHTHVPAEYQTQGRPVFMCPALKNNFDLDANTLLPPGYRTYEFSADGSMSSELHLVDDPRWPRSPMPRAVIALLNGELTFEEFNTIVARKRAT